MSRLREDNINNKNENHLQYKESLKLKQKQKLAKSIINHNNKIKYSIKHKNIKHLQTGYGNMSAIGSWERR